MIKVIRGYEQEHSLQGEESSNLGFTIKQIGFSGLVSFSLKMSDSQIGIRTNLDSVKLDIKKDKVPHNLQSFFSWLFQVRDSSWLLVNKSGQPIGIQ